MTIFKPLQKSYLLAAAFCLAVVSPLAADDGTTLNATVAGLGCNTAKGADQFGLLSFSWGASNPVTIGPGGIGSG
jgi:hypothetical protein